MRKTFQLLIDGAKKDAIYLALRVRGEICAQTILDPAVDHGEAILSGLDRLLKQSGLEKTALDAVLANPRGESYTTQRIVAATANALAYGWKCNLFIWGGLNDPNFANPAEVGENGFKVILPEYRCPPRITKKKKLP